MSDEHSLMKDLYKDLLQEDEKLPKFLADVAMGDATVTRIGDRWNVHFSQQGIPFPAKGGRAEIEVLEREIKALLDAIGRRRGLKISQIKALFTPNTEGMDPELADATALAAEAISLNDFKRSRTPKTFAALFHGLRLGWLLCRIGVRPCEKMFKNNLELRKSQLARGKQMRAASQNSRAAEEYEKEISAGYKGQKKALLLELKEKYKGSTVEGIRTALRRLKEAPE